MDIKEAEKRGYRLQRRIEYYAIDSRGNYYCLVPDWRLETAYNWRKKPKTRKTK